MVDSLPYVDAVSFLIRKNDNILVEQRSPIKENDPGIIAIPGGHVENGESLEEACRRELLEELGLTCESCELIYIGKHTTLHENQTVHYFNCMGWRGTPSCNEADAIFWLGFDDKDSLFHEIDRTALEKIENK